MLRGLTAVLVLYVGGGCSSWALREDALVRELRMAMIEPTETAPVT
jgi:hypothetical protein